ncbi:MAG: DUF302 domain-containing protein [Deinococcales bacterium]
MSKLAGSVRAVVVVLGLLMAAGLASAQSGPQFLHAASSVSFDATVSSLKRAVASNGMMVLGHLNQKGALSTTGLSLRGAEAFFVGNPVVGKKLFQTDPSVGVVIPLRMYVWVDSSGKTEVGYFRPSDLFVGVSPALAKAGATMDGVFAKILSQATQ